jgi:hypothetical protein
MEKTYSETEQNRVLEEVSDFVFGFVRKAAM